MTIFGMKTSLQWAPPYRSPNGCSSAPLDNWLPATKNGRLRPGATTSGRAKLSVACFQWLSFRSWSKAIFAGR
jgi:hypothetical protein